MIESKELRIGNFVSDSEYKYLTIEGIHPKSTNQLTIGINGVDSGDRMFSEINPIKLTKEWLNKFVFEDGFEVGLSDDDFMKDQMSVRIDNKIVIKIKYVHQLQNLHFSLYGKELELKDD